MQLCHERHSESSLLFTKPPGLFDHSLSSHGEDYPDTSALITRNLGHSDLRLTGIGCNYDFKTLLEETRSAAFPHLWAANPVLFMMPRAFPWYDILRQPIAFRQVLRMLPR